MLVTGTYLFYEHWVTTNSVDLFIDSKSHKKNIDTKSSYNNF